MTRAFKASERQKVARGRVGALICGIDVILGDGLLCRVSLWPGLSSIARRRKYDERPSPGLSGVRSQAMRLR
jgi:hypothetical protein